MKTEAERGVKEHQQPPEAGKGKERVLPQSARGGMALPAPWFWASSLQNCEGIHFCWMSLLVHRNLLWQP